MFFKSANWSVLPVGCVRSIESTPLAALVLHLVNGTPMVASIVALMQTLPMDGRVTETSVEADVVVVLDVPSMFAEYAPPND